MWASPVAACHLTKSCYNIAISLTYRSGMLHDNLLGWWHCLEPTPWIYAKTWNQSVVFRQSSWPYWFCDSKNWNLQTRVSLAEGPKHDPVSQGKFHRVKINQITRQPLHIPAQVSHCHEWGVNPLQRDQNLHIGGTAPMFSGEYLMYCQHVHHTMQHLGIVHQLGNRKRCESQTQCLWYSKFWGSEHMFTFQEIKRFRDRVYGTILVTQ